MWLSVMIILFLSFWPSSVSWWHVYSRAVVFQPCTEAKETLYSFPIELLLYARPLFSTVTLIFPTWPVAPPPRPLNIVFVSSPDCPLSKRPDPPPPAISVRSCSPIPKSPLQLWLVPGMPAPLAAVNLHWPAASDRIQPMPGCPPKTLPDRSPRRLRSCSPTVLLVVLGSWSGGRGVDQ